MKQKIKFDAFPYLMCAPALVLFTLFSILPFLQGLWTSFYNWDGLSDMKWIGLNNYLFTIQDKIFWKAISNTAIYALVVTLAKNLLGLFFGYFLAKSFRGRTLFRTAIYLPVTLSYIVIGILWSWIYNPTFGILDSLLSAVGAQGLITGWLSNPDIVLYSICWIDIWKWTGFHVMLYMAGYQGISRDYYEAAAIDGANAVQRFTRITIPMLNSTIVVNIMLSLTGAFVSNYDIVKIMTDGGPMHASEVSLTYIVRTAFGFSSMGKANAMSMILFLMVLVFGFIQLRLMTRDENYE